MITGGSPLNLARRAESATIPKRWSGHWHDYWSIIESARFFAYRYCGFPIDTLLHLAYDEANPSFLLGRSFPPHVVIESQ
jgi:hypothetical protein